MTPKAFDLLVILLEYAGRTVTVDALMSALWPNNEEANDATLRQHVLMVRRALGDRIRDPRYVVTDYGKGYRFVGPVTPGPSFLTQTIVEELCEAAVEFRRSRSGAGLRRALDLYHRALTIDPQSPAALAGAALCRCLIADNLRETPRPLLERAREQSDAALSTDPDCVDGLLARARVALHLDGDGTIALALAQRAAALAPHDALAVGLNVWFLTLQSRFREAHHQLDNWEPGRRDSELVRTYRGTALFFQREYAAAVAELSAACAVRSHALFARTCLGRALFMAGDVARAVSEFDGVRLCAYDPLADGEIDMRFVAEGYALYARFRFGDSSVAEASLERLQRLSLGQYVPAVCFALAEAGRRRYRKAFEHVQRSRENGEWWYAQFGVDPFLDDLRAHAQNPR